ncbi:sulfotransferase [uncultured Croceitalea sp.]|uniref:sulfotransferase n=1 Tax=uncultured Croceitalea sp. TaxID=1798908 RepID=UPI00330689CD
MVDQKEKIKVIYVMGSGRSGSTLLSIILNTVPNIVSPGEINNLPRLPQENFKCSCGDRVAECVFWSKVFERWKKNSGEYAVQSTIDNMNSFENFTSLSVWVKTLFKASVKSKSLQKHLDGIYDFLNSTLIESKKTVLVDISKNPLRAYVMSLNKNIDLRIIHLVRDGRGMAWSLNKFVKKDVKQRPIWRSALYWLVLNKMSNFVRKRAKKTLLLKYEDIVTKPNSTLEKVAEFSGIDVNPMIKSISSELVQEELHIMAGNALRKQKSIKLRLDTEWHHKMSRKKQVTFNLIAGRTMKSYGYQKISQLGS